MRKKLMTVSEVLAKVSDPGWAQKRDAEEQARLRHQAEMRLAEEPLIQDLARIGMPVRSVWELVNTRSDYPVAVPILLQHLTRPYPDDVREGIARALAVPSARPAWQDLKKLFIQEPNEDVKDALGAALVGASDDSVIADVIALARNVELGPSRVMLLRALERSDDPRAKAALMDLGAEPHISEQAQISLRTLLRRQQRRTKKR